MYTILVYETCFCQKMEWDLNGMSVKPFYKLGQFFSENTIWKMEHRIFVHESLQPRNLHRLILYPWVTCVKEIGV